MFGIDPVTITSMLVLAGYKPECPTHEPTKINITPISEKIKYDVSQSLKELQQYDMDTVDPYGFHGTSITRAFMNGSVGLSYEMTFASQPIPEYKISCQWYDQINVKIEVAPTIVVAKEIYHDPCMRKAVIGHELKHVQVDRVIVNKYAKIIGQKLFSELSSRGFTAGPFASEREEEIRNKMMHVVSQIIDLEQEKMNIERREQQRAVDTLKEYERVDDQCPEFKKKKASVYADILK